MLCDRLPTCSTRKTTSAPVMSPIFNDPKSWENVRYVDGAPYVLLGALSEARQRTG
jgi:hypothetical protein